MALPRERESEHAIIVADGWFSHSSGRPLLREVDPIHARLGRGEHRFSGKL